MTSVKADLTSPRNFINHGKLTLVRGMLVTNCLILRTQWLSGGHPLQGWPSTSSMNPFENLVNCSYAISKPSRAP